ncbi:hypothetical protein OIU77_009279 [Salix suchowensis]|uniref:Secreted protein n=1 Tax=Salix suchowensis TaxID=1278906 RepID=A0ABQ9AF17_9ROSI|nr:hypothetical protein OIU77_009279 [Salix suchowensis]
MAMPSFNGGIFLLLLFLLGLLFLFSSFFAGFGISTSSAMTTGSSPSCSSISAARTPHFGVKNSRSS